MELAGDLVESVGSTLPEIPVVNTETELATSFRQVGLSLTGGKHQLTYQNFNPKYMLPTKCTGIKKDQRLKCHPVTNPP